MLAVLLSISMWGQPGVGSGAAPPPPVIHGILPSLQTVRIPAPVIRPAQPGERRRDSDSPGAAPVVRPFRAKGETPGKKVMDDQAVPRVRVKNGPMPPLEQLPRATNSTALFDAPPSVRTFENRKKYVLPLRQALLVAVDSNRGINVQRYQTRTAQEILFQSQTVFDPVWTLGSQWRSTAELLANTVDVAGSGSNFQKVNYFGAEADQPNQASLVFPLRTGGSLNVDWEVGRSFQRPQGGFTSINPAWRNQTNFTLLQPIFQDAGFRVAETPITIARASWQATEYDFAGSVNRLFLDVEVQYWNLAIALRELSIRDSALIHAEKILEKELEKKQIGESSRPEVGQAKEHYRRSRMAVLNAQQQVLEEERELRELVGLPGFDGIRFTIPQDEDIATVDIDWTASVDTMLARRPELASQNQQVNIAYAKLLLARNRTLPDVDFAASYGLPGLGGTFSQSVDRMFDGSYYEWTIGFTVTRPVQNRLVNSQLREATYNYSREQDVLEKIQFELVHELQAAYQKLILAEQNSVESRALRMAAQERLEAYREFHRLGNVGIDILLRSEASYTFAMIQERQAYLSFRQAIAEWEYARGTILDKQNFLNN